MSGEYAILAMLYLSAKPFGETSHIADIAKDQKVPESILRKIMGHLVKAGLLHSYRGKNGGITLARAADSITLLDVIKVIEGKIFLNKCLIGSEFCDRIGSCAVHSVWRQVQDNMIETLENKTFASLVSEEELLQQTYAT